MGHTQQKLLQFTFLTVLCSRHDRNSGRSDAMNMGKACKKHIIFVLAALLALRNVWRFLVSKKPERASGGDASPRNHHPKNVTGSFASGSRATAKLIKSGAFDNVSERRERETTQRQRVIPQNRTTVAESTTVSNITRSIHPKNHSSTSSSKQQSCYSLNSEDWLKGPRLGNNGDLIEDDHVRHVILEMPYALKRADSIPLLSSTLCHAQSRFVSDTINDAQDEKAIRLWVVRLVYLAFHYHQHHWAIPEAKLRLNDSSGECDAARETTAAAATTTKPLILLPTLILPPRRLDMTKRDLVVVPTDLALMIKHPQVL